jgi:hypothetical protein
MAAVILSQGSLRGHSSQVTRQGPEWVVVDSGS